MWIHRFQMAFLCRIVIIMLLASHGRSVDITMKKSSTASSFKDMQDTSIKPSTKIVNQKPEPSNPMDNLNSDDITFPTNVNPRLVKSVKILTSISQTFDAIKTIGKYIFNCKSITTERPNSSPNTSAEGSQKPDELSSAIYTVSKKVLGQNITEKVVKPLVNLSHGKVSPDNRVCITPDGSEGYCDDYKNCPQLSIDLFADSICFRNMFSTGVCCPRETQTFKPMDDKFTTPHDFETQAPIKSSSNTLPPENDKSTTPHDFETQAPIKSSSNTLPPENLILFTDAPIQPPKNLTRSLKAPNMLEEEVCGRPYSRKPRVVGGVEALPGRWPWMAAISVNVFGVTVPLCGGTLIGPRHILTAAHCTRNTRLIPFESQQFSVLLGDVDLLRDDETSSPEKYSVVNIRAHQNFSSSSLGVVYSEMLFNDIAILILDRPVTYSKYIMPLCLPPESLKLNTFAGQMSTTVGWGNMRYNGKDSTVQREVDLPVWSNKDCKRIYYRYVKDDILCAGFKEGGKDSCQGDSGGPLMLEKNGRWIQIGIVSFGNKCGKRGFPGVYTRVTQYLDWINENMV